MMGYEEDLSIDKNNLDEECVHDAGIYDVWARAEAHAKLLFEKAKDRLKVIEAEVELKIRGMEKDELSLKYNINSVTDKAVTAIVLTDPKVREAKKDYLQTQHRVSLTETARRSLDKRGSRLDNLIFLHGQGYFGRGKGSLKKEAIKTLKTKYAEVLEESGLTGDEGVEVDEKTINTGTDYNRAVPREPAPSRFPQPEEKGDGGVKKKRKKQTKTESKETKDGREEEE